MIITNKTDLRLWLQTRNIYIPVNEIPEVEPIIRNSKWKEIDHRFCDIDYLFKEKSEPNYGILKCCVWLRESKQQIEFRLVRSCPIYTRYGKIKPQYISIDKKKDLFSSKEKFFYYVQSLYIYHDFKLLE